MENHNIIIEINGLNAEREGVKLTNINWKVKSSENWCVLGPNASGKTALALVLSRFNPAVHGSLSLFGKSYSSREWRDLKKDITLITPAGCDRILPSMKVMDVVCGVRDNTTAKPQYPGSIEKRETVELLKKYGYEDLVKENWRDLMRGEKRMIMILSAIMAGYRLILLDDIFEYLDPKASKRMMSDLQKLISKPAAPAFIVFTRDPKHILPEISHVLMLKEGGIYQKGRKMDLITSEILSKLFDTSVLCDYNKGLFKAEFLI